MACGSTTSSRHRSDLAASSVTVPQPRTVIEYRKDGAVSKMRSHKGNIPILPQTKLCPHCPAKFTRTTHLNRHLRTHTGDRSHRCDTCDAQFTRSDLLTRHKKTCGDSSHANRTRRRSCQACADSKVKCDLQRPCSKCQARGKECVFVIRSSSARSSSGMGMVPTLSPHEAAATPVERRSVGSCSDDRVPVLIPATTHPHVASPSPKPYIPADHSHSLLIDQQQQQAEGDCHWVAAPPPSGAAGSDVVTAPSPSERFCSGSAAASSSGSPGSIPAQPSSSSPFSTFFQGDLLDPFLVYPSYGSSTSVPSDHSHSSSDPVVPSPISAVDDPTTFNPTAPPHGAVDVQQQQQHPFHASGGSVYYAPPPPSSATEHQQLQDVISKQQHVHLQRHHHRYAHDHHFMPTFSGATHDNFKQHQHQNLTEEHHHYVFDSSHAHPTAGHGGRSSRAARTSPYQACANARRALRESQFAGPGQQLHLASFVDPLDGGDYCYDGRNYEKTTGGGGNVVTTADHHHWPTVALEGEAPFDALSRFDDQRYRAAVAVAAAECAVDALQPWNGMHAVGRRQVIEPA